VSQRLLHLSERFHTSSLWCAKLRSVALLQDLQKYLPSLGIEEAKLPDLSTCAQRKNTSTELPRQSSVRLYKCHQQATEIQLRLSTIPLRMQPQAAMLLSKAQVLLSSSVPAHGGSSLVYMSQAPSHSLGNSFDLCCQHMKVETPSLRTPASVGRHAFCLALCDNDLACVVMMTLQLASRRIETPAAPCLVVSVWL
jgi:hypothetical protein